MTNEESSTLIHKALTNQIEQEEKEHLHQWLNENDKNRAFFSEIQAIWEVAETEGPDEILDEEFEQELKKFEKVMEDSLTKQKQQKQRKIRTRIFLVTCLIGQGISFVLSFGHPKFSNSVSILAALTMVILVMLIFRTPKDFG